MEQPPVFRGRYLNGDGTFSVSCGMALRRARGLTSIKGRPVPEFTWMIRQHNLAEWNSDARLRLPRSAADIQVKAQLILLPRMVAARASPQFAPSASTWTEGNSTIVGSHPMRLLGQDAPADPNGLPGGSHCWSGILLVVMLDDHVHILAASDEVSQAWPRPSPPDVGSCNPRSPAAGRAVAQQFFRASRSCVARKSCEETNDRGRHTFRSFAYAVALPRFRRARLVATPIAANGCPDQTPRVSAFELGEKFGCHRRERCNCRHDPSLPA